MIAMSMPTSMPTSMQRLYNAAIIEDDFFKTQVEMKPLPISEVIFDCKYLLMHL